MRVRNLIMILLLAIILPVSQLNAQQTVSQNQTVEVRLNDGNILIGTIIQQDSEEITLSSSTFGEMTLSRSTIKSITPITKSTALSNSRYGFANPNPSKYLLGSSSIPMEKGSVSFQSVWIFFNSFTYTPVEYFSITGGFEIISMFFGASGPYFYMLNPRVSFNVVDNLYIGGNIMYINSLKTTTTFSGLATLNANASYGTADHNITAGLGWGWVESQFSTKPIITVAGMTRLTKGLGLVSENWMIPSLINETGYYGIFSYGLRFIGEKTTIDLAFINNPDIFNAIIIGIPYVDFCVKF